MSANPVLTHWAPEERALQTEGRLARMEAKLDSVSARMDDLLLTQRTDHGRRISRLEERILWAAGWVAGSAAAASAMTAIITNTLN